MIEAVIFDLDYTLYDTSQFYRGAFAEMSLWLGDRHGRDSSALCQLLESCWRELTSGHPRLFDVFLDRAQLPPEEVPTLVGHLHEHVPNGLELYPDADRALTELAERCRLGIVTDGHAVMQRTKLQALGLGDRVDLVIVTAEHGPTWAKPSPAPFRAALDALAVEPSAAIYVGDNPRLDAGGPNHAGMKSVRLLRGEFAELPALTSAPFVAEITSHERLLDEAFMAGL